MLEKSSFKGRRPERFILESGSAAPKLGRGWRHPCRHSCHVRASHGGDPEGFWVTCVIAGTTHPQDTDLQALKDFPLQSFIYHLPLTPSLRALSGQLVVPESCPKRADCDFAPTPSCAPSRGGSPGAPPSPPFPRLKYSPSSASSQCRKQPPALGSPKTPLCFPPPRGAETPHPGDKGLDAAPALRWDRCSRRELVLENEP